MIRTAVVVILILLAVRAAMGQHHHPPADAGMHDSFYMTWMVPNNGAPRVSSCCSGKDCYPVEVRSGRFGWEFRRREDGAWLPIPENRIEQNQADPRESPDHRNHVCAPPPTSGVTKVYCFTFGSAI